MATSPKNSCARSGPAPGGDSHLLHLLQAEYFIRLNLRTDFSLFDLSKAVGASPSTLLRAFRGHHGIPPMQYVRRLRLEAVRTLLLAAEPEIGAVGQIATEFGFQQLGRFSAQYRIAFGELPSATLRRSENRLHRPEA